MSLRLRLAMLMALLTVLPTLPAALVARNVISRTLDLGFSTDVDAALDAGVRQARANFVLQRAALGDSLATWARETLGEDLDPAAVRGLPADDPRLVTAPGACVLLDEGDGRVRVVRGDPRHMVEPGTSAPDEPPHLVSATIALSGGGSLEARAPVAATWRADARQLATSLQAMRGLQVQRVELERGFWLPFLAIVVIGLVAALAAAAWLSRGLTVPLGHLDAAARAVAAGSWDVQVPPTGSGELRQLGTRFNAMVRTLDAQSRRLVDLETMAGWREMARALAHEVKNPLTPIQLTVEEIRERYHGDDPEYRTLLEECTRIIVHEVESLRNVVTRFREFSRPVEPHFAPVDLNRLVTEIGALQRDMRVEVDTAPDLAPILADDDQLRQMLMNLARNAQQATADQAEPRLRLATRATPTGAVVTVEDSGDGVPAAERERIFEPYRTGKSGGLGLGLALVKGIVLAHGGVIRVDDGPRGGARFVIELPRDPNPRSDA